MKGFSNFPELSGNRRRSRWNVFGLMLAGVLSAGLILVSSVSASHPTFRVVPSGADNATTFATLQAAVNAAAGGETIIIDAETPGATVDKPLLIKGGFGFVTADAAPPVVPFLGGTTGITLADGSTGTVIDGVTFAAPSAGGSAPDTGVFSNPSAFLNNVLIEGCTFVNVQRGVMVTGSAIDYTIKANKIFLSDPATSTQIGVFIIDGPTGTAIVNNTIFGLATASVPSAVYGVILQRTATGTDNATISKNRIVAETGSAVALFPSASNDLDTVSVVGNDLTGSAFTSGNFAADPGAFAVDIRAGAVTNTTPPNDFDAITGGAGSVTNLQVFGNTQDSNAIAFPTITSISPSSAASGSSDTTITVTGTNYDATSVIRIESRNVELPTTLNSITELQATIPSDLLTDEGFLFITVINKGQNVCSTPKVFSITSSGGGGGTEPFFCTGVSPQAFPANSSPAIITVSGNGFIGGSATIRVNGANQTTTFVDSHTLTANIAAAIAGASPGTNFTISVMQGSDECFPGTVRIQVATPTITTINGSATPTVCAGDVTQTLSIVGTNFAPGLNVLFDSNSLGGAGFGSSTTASATLDASLILTPGSHTVKIRNNGDGGPQDSAGFTLDVIECTPLILSRVAPSGTVSRSSASRSGMFLQVTARKSYTGVKFVLKKNGVGSEFVFTPSSFSTGGGTQNIQVNVPKTFFTAGLTSISVQIRNVGGATSAVNTITVN